MKSDNLLFLKTSFMLVLTFFLLTGCARDVVHKNAQVENNTCISKGWPHDNSDLKPDPSVIFGTLENGLRYVIKHNEEPKDRVGLYLNIQAGSLAEKDDQLGYAHFLEHMLFNGTTHYPPGTLVEYFQSIGMAFGSDTNAHTSFDETVYRLLLPDGSEKHLSSGLLVMADYARGALLLEDEVERERGIILAEKRTRDSINYRMWEKRTQFSFAGTRVAKRFPIGIDETIEKADSQSLRSFYDSWYRPKNLILVVVGDVDTELVEQLIAKRFESLTAPPKETYCYDIGKIKEEGKRFLYIHEPELGITELTINTHWNTEPERDSVVRQQEEMKKYIAISLFRNRLEQLVRKPGSPLTKAVAYSGNFLQRFGYASIIGRVEGENWNQGFELINVSLRQAIELGFSSRELTRVKKEILAELEKDVKTAASRDSRKLASNIIDALNTNQVFLSPEQALQLYAPVINSLTLEQANATFRALWSHDNRKIIVAGTADIKDDKNPENSIRRLFETAQHQELSSWQENGIVKFPYLPVPEKKGKVVDHKHFEDIDIYRYTFANGTILNIKKTLFKPNEVSLEVHFGSGKQSEKTPGLSMLAASVVNESGTGRLSKVELDDALAGHTANLSFKVGEESFYLTGNGLNSELELLFQLVRTRLLDSAFRDDAYMLSMERFTQMYETLTSSVDGLMPLKGQSFLVGGNPHYGYPPFDQFQKLTLDQIREWLEPILAGALLEVSIVGDVEPEQVAELAGRYLGNLDRKYVDEDVTGPVVFPAGESLKDSVGTQVDKAQVIVAWPTDDFWNISRTRRLNILAEVLSERLRVEIREKMGAVYSPQVYNRSSRTEPGYGVLQAMLTVDPARSEELVEQVRKVGTGLASEGIDKDELKRTLEPVLTSIKDMRETNNYWLHSVMTLSSRHPEQLEWPLTIQKDFASITANEISEYAAHYLKPDVTASIIFLPKKE